MVRYLLRADHLHREDPQAPSRRCWHVSRVGAAFALCTRQLQPATSVRPIQDAEGVPEAQRCAECWDRAFDELMLPA
jgi:hypothetical protein